MYDKLLKEIFRIKIEEKKNKPWFPPDWLFIAGLWTEYVGDVGEYERFGEYDGDVGLYEGLVGE